MIECGTVGWGASGETAIGGAAIGNTVGAIGAAGVTGWATEGAIEAAGAGVTVGVNVGDDAMAGGGGATKTCRQTGHKMGWPIRLMSES